MLRIQAARMNNENRRDEPAVSIAALNPATNAQFVGRETSTRARSDLAKIVSRQRIPWWRRRRIVIPIAIGVAIATGAATYALTRPVTKPAYVPHGLATRLFR